jgi:hypothetical protein
MVASRIPVREGWPVKIRLGYEVRERSSSQHIHNIMDIVPGTTWLVSKSFAGGNQRWPK